MKKEMKPTKSEFMYYAKCPVCDLSWEEHSKDSYGHCKNLYQDLDEKAPLHPKFKPL